MKKNYPVPGMFLATALLLLFTLQACNKHKDTMPPPPPVDSLSNATKEQLDYNVMTMVLDMRVAMDAYFDAIGVVGREIYRFSSTEPRYTTDLLGSGDVTLGNDKFYIMVPWKARYRVITEALQLIKVAGKSTKITDAALRGYIGVAKTVIAHELLMNLNLTGANGIYINLAADNPASGPIVPQGAALDSIARLLDDSKTVLMGAVLPPLPTGFTDYVDVPGFLKVNRALAARVAVYRQQWSAALTALNESFFSMNGDLTAGPKHAFATFQGDILNPCFIAKNASDNVRLTHPAFAANILPGDDRINKTSLRTSAKSQDGLTSNRDLWIYPVNVTSVPIIRNEELVLIYAEAKIQLSQFPDAIVALNRIRSAHGLTAYSGGVSQSALITELLNQRRYSLFGEGHYWIDMRRYGKLNTLPVDRTNDDVWDKFPVPVQ
ncbi:hypothetical protein A4H97_19965 [Niastella yeongjuensis]|uniref:RagB/SusD domain-containing protein n=1 Tax=Niastella yeongjuensis TaxID=354355 RepID=A0A1V9FC69_9BACT|nr:RagB/SusD family nutrient uptake outer membrane protein [Niastella yeongjuensis]OQP55872.1 hypothetical protein A4H97_19965 [Niastella yeongjuensis]SEP47214.1 SusD family protein [Niastella yeongjuensis]